MEQDTLDVAENKVKSGYSSKNHVLKFMFKKFFDKIWQNICELDADDILDVGCGEGVVIRDILQQNSELCITGLDISRDNLNVAEELNPTARFVLGDVYELPFENDSFDLVICTEVLEHLKDPERAVAELKRVSKKYCIISVPHEPFFRMGNILKLSYLRDWGNTPGHVQNWSRGSFENLLKKQFGHVSISSSLIVWTFALCEK